jgi:GTPase SAR1 family protein
MLKRLVRARNASMASDSSGALSSPPSSRASSPPPSQEKNKQDEAIAQQLEQWRSMESKVFKVAVLGLEGSGKLTMLQHFKMINQEAHHGSPDKSNNLEPPKEADEVRKSQSIDVFEMDDEKHIVPIVHKRVIDLFKSAVASNAVLDVEASNVIKSFEGEEMTPEFKKALQSIWRDSVFQSALLFHKWADYFEYVSANYWGERLADLVKPDYMPTETDILTVMVEMRRESLSAFIDTEVMVDDFKIQLSCPYRNKWKKLLPVFLPSVHAIVMMLDSSHFGYVESATDPVASRNRCPVIETRNQLKGYVDNLSRLNAKCCIFLVMNKIDLLEKNLKMDNAGSFHPDFQTLDEDVDKYQDWITRTYSEMLAASNFDTKYFHVLRLNAKSHDSLKDVAETIHSKIQHYMKNRKF